MAVIARSDRPWHRLHGTTLLVVAAVVVAIGACQLSPREGIGHGGSWRYEAAIGYGWPFITVSQAVTEEVYGLPGAWRTSKQVNSAFRLPEAFADVVFAVVVLGATARVIERWMRQPNRLQCSLRTMLVATTSVAVVAALLHYEFAWSFRLIGWRGDTCYLNGTVLGRPLLVQVPLLFGVGCVVHFGILQIAHVVGRAATRRKELTTARSHQGCRLDAITSRIIASRS